MPTSRPGHSLADVGEALPERLRPPAEMLQELKKKPAKGAIMLPSTTIHLLSNVHEQVSSTEIRAAAGKSVRKLKRFVPRPVAEYIRKQTTANAERFILVDPLDGTREFRNE